MASFGTSKAPMAMANEIAVLAVQANCSLNFAHTLFQYLRFVSDSTIHTPLFSFE